MRQVASVQLQVSRNNVETLCKKEGASFGQRCHPRKSPQLIVSLQVGLRDNRFFSWRSEVLRGQWQQRRVTVLADRCFYLSEVACRETRCRGPESKARREVCFFSSPFCVKLDVEVFLLWLLFQESLPVQTNCSLCAATSVQGVRGVDSARWPNSNPPGGVAQGGLQIPVINSEFGVDGGGVERKDGHGSGTSRSGRSNML